MKIFSLNYKNNSTYEEICKEMEMSDIIIGNVDIYLEKKISVKYI